MEEKQTINPLSADEIIAGLEKKGRRRLSKNIEIMIRILSEKALFPFELVAQLKNNPDYSCRGSSDWKLSQRMQTLRHHKILGRLDGWYFIKGTIVDPEVQYRIGARNLLFNQSKKVPGEIRSLRSIIYEILQKESSPVNRLAMRVKNHPDYDGSYGQGKKLLQAINRTLNERKNRKRFFEKESEQKRYSVWRIKSGSNPPLREFHQRPRPRREQLYQFMRTRSVIKGWPYLDLLEEVSKPGSGYQVKPSSSPHSVMVVLGRILNKNKGECFECISAKGELKRWRAKWLGPLKTPSSAEDFKDLSSKALDDLILPISLDNLLKVIRQHGHLFGYMTNELPLPFLRNNVVRAIAGTEYAKKIQG